MVFDKKDLDNANKIENMEHKCSVEEGNKALVLMILKEDKKVEILSKRRRRRRRESDQGDRGEQQSERRTEYD